MHPSTEHQVKPNASPRQTARETAALLGRIDACAQQLDLLQGLLQTHEDALSTYIKTLELALHEAGLKTPEEIAQAYEALDPAQRNAIERELAAPSHPSPPPSAKAARRRMDRMV